MTIQKRLMLAAAVFAFASVLYGVAKYYSPVLVLHVVEQSLAQKAPAGMDSTQLHERLQRFLSTAPDKNKQMIKLLRISEYLEKVQYLTPAELDEIIPIEKPAASPAL
jgi:hypothetical protein